MHADQKSFLENEPLRIPFVFATLHVKVPLPFRKICAPGIKTEPGTILHEGEPHSHAWSVSKLPLVCSSTGTVKVILSIGYVISK